MHRSNSQPPSQVPCLKKGKDKQKSQNIYIFNSRSWRIEDSSFDMIKDYVIDVGIDYPFVILGGAGTEKSAVWWHGLLM